MARQNASAETEFHEGAPGGDDALDQVFRALADRTRRDLLARLAAGPARITDLAEPYPMSLAAVSKHIRVLESANLIQRTVDGRVHRCALSAEPLRDAVGWLEHYRGFWTDQLDALARYVEDTPEESDP
jgi:DNA-binding transcriptional ArsR family regulator